MEVRHDAQKTKGKFTLEDNGREIGEMTYVFVDDKTIDINHTLIDESYRGRDLGLLLIEKSAEFMRAQQIKAIPTCPYVEKIFKKSSKYNDVRA